MLETNDLQVMLSDIQSVLRKMTNGIDALRENDYEIEHAKDKLWRARRIDNEQLKVLTVAKAIDIATGLKWYLTNNFTANCENNADLKRVKETERRVADAVRAWWLLSECVRIEFNGYELLGEEEACYECLSKYAVFLFQNKLYDRDTAYWLFSNLPVKDKEPLLYEDLMRAVFNYCDFFAGV